MHSEGGFQVSSHVRLHRPFFLCFASRCSAAPCPSKPNPFVYISQLLSRSNLQMKTAVSPVRSEAAVNSRRLHPIFRPCPGHASPRLLFLLCHKTGEPPGRITRHHAPETGHFSASVVAGKALRGNGPRRTGGNLARAASCFDISRCRYRPRRFCSGACRPPDKDVHVVGGSYEFDR